MPTIGNISVPAASVVGTFPFASEYPHQQAHEPAVAVHTFGSANAKTEQRFLLGQGVVKFTIKRRMNVANRAALTSFWTARNGAFGQFTYNAPNFDGTTTAYRCRFADQNLTIDSAQVLLGTVGLTLYGVPTTIPTYSLNSTVTRFPDSSTQTALLSQAQEMIPLCRITVLDTSVPIMYLADRACTIGSQSWQPRLLKYDGIQQSIGGAADQASFSFGNADRVMTAVANDCDLYRAWVEFSLFNVANGVKIDLWAGQVTDWHFDRGPVFSMSAADGVYELTLPYPVRKISRLCDKVFNSATSGCPWATASGVGSSVSCDKSWDGTNGCVSHVMQPYFRGIVAQPQGVRVSEGPIHTAASIVADTVYDQVLPEVWCHSTNPDVSKGLVVNAKVITGRDEGEFYSALGIVSQGPISEYGRAAWWAAPPAAGVVPTAGYPAGASSNKNFPSGVNNVAVAHKLDGQPHHGYPADNQGLRLSYGRDPAVANAPDGSSDKFSLSQGANGVQTFGTQKAAGLAFVEIRRIDEKGLQPSETTTHTMTVTVRGGMAGYVWTAPGTASLVAAVDNPAWVLINIFLRGRGLYDTGNISLMEASFDAQAAIDAATVCDTLVTPIIGNPATTEKQYKFSGVFSTEKPLRDWMQDVANCFLGQFTFSFGKLRISARTNSSVLNAFTDGNIIFNSLELGPSRPAFNHLTATFGDEEFDYQANSVALYDIDHATLLSRTNGAVPQFLKKNVDLVGVSTKSQAARIITPRLREELGGVNAPQWKAARTIKFKTTVLALNTECGSVCSITHPDMPTYPVTNVSIGDPNYQAAQATYGEFRVESWRLLPDYSIEVIGRSTHNDMYSLTAGPKPADVVADLVPLETQDPPSAPAFDLEVRGDGKLRVTNLTCQDNANAVAQVNFETYYVDEPAASYGNVGGGVNNSATTGINYFGAPPVVGGFVMIDDELLEVTAQTPGGTPGFGTFDVAARGALGTTPASHARVTTTVSAISGSWSCQLTLPSGLNLRADTHLVRVTGGLRSLITYYDNATGLTRLALPIAGLTAGDSVYVDPRLWLITKRSDLTPLPYGFLRTPQRADWLVLIDQLNAAVRLFRGQFLSGRGINSAWTTKLNTGVMTRTGGGARYVFPIAGYPAGAGTGPAFHDIASDEAQMFGGASADLASGPAGPLASPSAPAAGIPGNFAHNATILISTPGGLPGPSAQVGITVTGAANLTVPPWSLADDPTSNTPALIATALQNWLMGDDNFPLYYSAAALAGVISITDLTGIGGTVGATGTDGISALASGFSSTLGVMRGRRYSLVYTGGGYRSELGSLSPSSGPTGAAGNISISGIPAPADSRVTNVEIYAYPDGYIPNTPRNGSAFVVPRLVGTIAAGVDTFLDTTTETARGAATLYPGATQPTGSGAVTIVVTQDDIPWFQLFVPSGAATSNTVNGPAMLPIALGARVNAIIDNQTGGAIDMRVTLE